MATKWKYYYFVGATNTKLQALAMVGGNYAGKMTAE